MTDEPMNEPVVIARSFAAELEVADGRTIVGRLVPYGVRALVQDMDPPGDLAGTPLGDPYYEQMAPGMFARSTRAAPRYLLNYEHRGGLLDQIGRAVELDDRDDALYGSFRAFDGAVGDQGLELIRSGAATFLSVQARIPRRTSRTLDDGTVERTRGHLEHVALTGTPAYADAGVLALRTAPPAGMAPGVAAVRAWQAVHAVPSRPTTT